MSGGRGVILVVDDVLEIRGMLVDCLETSGYLARAAGSAAEALLLLDTHPDTGFLLTDIVMPGGLNGYDLARRAQQITPGIQVAFMTAHAAAEMIGDAMPGRPVILQKPFWFEHLIRVVDAAFATKMVNGSGSSMAPEPRTPPGGSERAQQPTEA